MAPSERRRELFTTAAGHYDPPVRVGLTLRPGQRGTRKLVAVYGERLVCVRYRYDAERGVRQKTVEIVVDEVPWQPRPRPFDPGSVVGLRVRWGEIEVSRRVRAAGGTWRRDLGLWLIPYREAVELGMQDRVVVRPAKTTKPTTRTAPGPRTNYRSPSSPPETR